MRALMCRKPKLQSYSAALPAHMSQSTWGILQADRDLWNVTLGFFIKY